MNANLSATQTSVAFDSNVVVRKFIGGLEGGRTLDLHGYTPDVVKEGHVIIKLASGNYAPMPITASNAYDSLPSGASYVGILYRSVTKENPSASILTNGEVNPNAVPYSMTAILSAFKSACPFIQFENDEDSNNPLKASKSLMTLASSGTDTATVSGAIGTVTVTGSNDTLTGSISGTTLTVVADASAQSGTIKLADQGGQEYVITVTISD